MQRFSLLDRIMVEKGDKSDWDQLHELHYKAENLAIGPRFWKATLDGKLVGVVVTAVPKGMLRERHLVFPSLRPGAGETRLTNTQRYKFLNDNFRVISRFVLDLPYRGIGAGYRMMNLVSRMTGLQFMEIQSSMSKYNQFGPRAGFRFAPPMPANNQTKVLKFFRSHFDASPMDFEAIMQEIAAKGDEARMFEICQEFYFKNSALENTTRGGDMIEARRENLNLRFLIRGIQQMGLASPMYGVWKNPDWGRTDIPDRLPLSAFDRQGPTERLIL
ncbi:hypothetical protein [Paracoccus litorisediminis]|uniref:Uncharacterized protein n=1 Tax=Paracoccus litorisediminis TaxID=2006130 RepID=A0A844HMP3_9RHOB|nr:hypothetical protein [Paracoccus litorisediminis]MTH61190.1 hypothetical protein [Paracoccus litorisediminis]